ncbi:hypothetical protein B0H14DRAFT_2604638 [Mycena olivaceomarginata]|nr:hypothetical protein B0H14DRAFT_2604638 [Mycena olivaceomarginata]
MALRTDGGGPQSDCVTASGNVESARESQGRGVWTNQVRKPETQVQAEDALSLPQSDRTSRDIFMIQTTRESLVYSRRADSGHGHRKSADMTMERCAETASDGTLYSRVHGHKNYTVLVEVGAKGKITKGSATEEGREGSKIDDDKTIQWERYWGARARVWGREGVGASGISVVPTERHRSVARIALGSPGSVHQQCSIHPSCRDLAVELASSRTRTHRTQAEIPKSHNPTPEEKYQIEIVEDEGRVESSRRKRFREERRKRVEWFRMESAHQRKASEEPENEYKEQK